MNGRVGEELSRLCESEILLGETGKRNRTKRNNRGNRAGTVSPGPYLIEGHARQFSGKGSGRFHNARRPISSFCARGELGNFPGSKGFYYTHYPEQNKDKDLTEKIMQDQNQLTKVIIDKVLEHDIQDNALFKQLISKLGNQQSLKRQNGNKMQTELTELAEQLSQERKMRQEMEETINKIQQEDLLLKLQHQHRLDELEANKNKYYEPIQELDQTKDFAGVVKDLSKSINALKEDIQHLKTNKRDRVLNAYSPASNSKSLSFAERDTDRVYAHKDIDVHIRRSKPPSKLYQSRKLPNFVYIRGRNRANGAQGNVSRVGTQKFMDQLNND